VPRVADSWQTSIDHHHLTGIKIVGFRHSDE